METNNDGKKTDLSAVHKAQLEMLKAVAAVLEEHKLRYCLYCGTLLGAIRHKGFIPWDDDIDLVMPLKDYRKFLRIASRVLPEGCRLQAPGKDAKHFCAWAKVYRDGTTMMKRSQAAYDANWSLYIDIYPMIGEYPLPRLRPLQGKLIQAAKSLLLMDFYRITGNYGTRHISAKKRLQAVPRPIRQAAARFLLSLAMWPTEKSERIGSIVAAPFCCKFERAWWSRMSRAAFEDAEFTVPAEYDKILTRIYGDYMTPPPEEKRYGHDSGTGDIIYDANRDYGAYREELLG